MKQTIVEFIEEGTDRVIRTCPLEEYNNQIESRNNLIPQEYKFLKKNVMKERYNLVLNPQQIQYLLQALVQSIEMESDLEQPDETYLDTILKLRNRLIENR